MTLDSSCGLCPGDFIAITYHNHLIKEHTLESAPFDFSVRLNKTTLSSFFVFDFFDARILISFRASSQSPEKWIGLVKSFGSSFCATVLNLYARFKESFLTPISPAIW